MRSSKSRSRNKNRNNKPQGNVVNRVFDSSGPEGKVRGTPQQIIDKYNQLARDSQLSGDRVATENFQQHAEHYLRLLAEAQREQEARREEQERQNRERQAQRDRERQERMERQERESNSTEQASGQVSGRAGGDDMPTDPGEAPQPDVFETADGGSTLVETPEEQASEPQAAKEEKPKRPRRAPKPKAPKSDKPASDGAKKASSKKAEKDAAESGADSASTPPEAAE